MNENNQSGRYIVFSMGNEKYAVPLLLVKEVIGHIKTTPVPQAPSYYLGMMNLRGSIISIIDLSAKLGMKKKGEAPNETVIILDIASGTIGVKVDSVDCVSNFKEQDIDDSEDFKHLSQGRYITGVAKSEKNLTLLINLEALFSTKDNSMIERQRKGLAAA